VQEYMVKALHEAKVNSSWTEPNSEWDKVVGEYIAKILTPRRGNRFLADFEPLADRISELGMVNSLAQTVLKITIPGVPDIYQGQELWDFSLVDPDNRRPVDYEARAKQLETLLKIPPPGSELLREWRDGRIKLLVTQKLLRFRRQNPALFRCGTYSEVKVEGQHADCCIAFLRKYGGQSALIIVPRLTSRVGSPPIGECWLDTRLTLETEVEGKGVDLFTDTPLPSDFALLRESLREFPVAVFVFSNGLNPNGGAHAN